MSILFSTNPTDWNQLDGIYIDETTPPPSVTGVPANTAILVAQFERGSPNIQNVGSVGELYEKYGNNLNYSGLVALQNKQFGLLKVVRVVASGALNAAQTLKSAGAVNLLTLTALWAGAYGNGIQVTVAAGTISGSKITVHDSNAGAVWPDEIYDNVLLAGATQASINAIFGASNLVSATLVATSAQPANQAATGCTGGSDGSVADTDYQSAIVNQCQGTNAGNILFLDSYTTGRNGYIQTSMAATTDKMGIVCGQPGDSVSTAVTAVSTLRDVQGRLIYSFPYVYTSIAGVSTRVAPASFYAALLSQISPHIDPAYAANAQYLQGIQSLDVNPSRADYISLAAAGISAFEFDSDIGFKIKSGVVTQISNSGLTMIFRRRMTDYICQSLGKFLKNYQNAVNSKSNRDQIAASIQSFNRLLETNGMVPSDAEVSGGKASIVDTESLNSPNSVAQGYMKIIYQRRIYSSMRYIVLQANIGESVVVTEQSA